MNSKQNTSSSVTSNICRQYQYDRKRRHSCASDSNLKSFNPLLHRHIFRCQKKIELITLIHFNQMKSVSSSELQNKDALMIYFCVSLWIQHAIARERKCCELYPCGNTVLLSLTNDERRQCISAKRTLLPVGYARRIQKETRCLASKSKRLQYIKG